MKAKGLILFFVILLLPFDSFAQTQLDPLMGTTWEFEKPFAKIVTFGSEITDYIGNSSIRCEDQAGRVAYVYYGQNNYSYNRGYKMTFNQTSINSNNSNIDYVFNINPDGLTGSGDFISCDTTTHSCYYGDLGKVVMLSQADSGSVKATLIDRKFFDPIINKQLFYELTSNDFNFSGTIYSNQLGGIYIENLNASVYKLKLKIEGYEDQIRNDISIKNGQINNLGNIYFHTSAGSITLTASKTGNGTITNIPAGISCGVDCTENYNPGTSVTLTANPDSGWYFTGWGGACLGTGQCTVTMDAAKSVTATFSLNTYAITLPPTTNGTISCNPITVNHGSNTSCSITPNTGYHFVTLTDNGANATSSVVGNTYAINDVVLNHTISATFAVNTYTITTAAGPNGSITPSSTVNHGSSATVAITPNANYHIADVLVDGVSVGAVASFNFQNITTAHTISAAFAIYTYTLAIAKAGTGSGIVTSAPGDINCGNVCSASYVAGTPVTLKATSTLGSTLTDWSGGSCSGTETCSLVINNNTQITALFSNPWGDVNNDNKIDLTDAILSLQVLSNMDTTGKTITIKADANNDSKIGLAEVLYILQKVAGMR